VVEDRGGRARRDDIAQRFGARVAEIVDACSDTDADPKPPWRMRKEAYLEHLADASPEALRVSLADKVYNARSIALDYRRQGEKLWSRFDADADQVWYFRSLLDVYRRVSTSALVDELANSVAELERLPGRRSA
jgi:(p)ppGpp synthase/HD superfamily hydrolase